MEVGAFQAPRVPTDAPIEAFGGGRAAAGAIQATSGLASDLANIGYQMQDEADKTRLLDEATAINQKTLDLRKAAETRLGENAIGFEQEALNDFDTFAKEREKGLASDRQRRMFQMSLAPRRQSIGAWAQGHEFQQTRVVTEKKREASIESFKGLAAEDPDAYGDIAGGLIRSVMDDRAQEFGWSKAQHAYETQKELTGMHTLTIDTMMSKGRDMDAVGYYQTFKGEIDPKAIPQLERALNEGSYRGQAQRLEDLIFSTQYIDQGEAGVERIDAAASLEEAQARAREIQDEKLRDLTMTRVTHRWNQMEKAAADRADKTMESWGRKLEKSRDLESMIQTDPAGWEAMGIRERDTLRIVASKMARTTEEKTDMKRWTVDMYGTPPQMLAKETVAQLYARKAYMTDTDYKAFAKEWKEAREGATKPEKFQSLIKDTELTLKAVQGLRLGGIDPKDDYEKIAKDDTKSQALWKFRQAYDSRMQAYHAETGKNPDDAQKEVILKKLEKDASRSVVIESHSMFGRDRSVKVMELEPKHYKMPWSVPWNAREKWFNLADSAGLVPKGGDRAARFKKWEDENRERVNRAALAADEGANDEQVRKILIEGR